MGDRGSYGGAPDPGSARDEAERLVAAALAMARSAASQARDRANAFGPLGQVISDVLDQAGVVPRPGRPGSATPPADRPEPTPTDPPRAARPHGATAEPEPEPTPEAVAEPQPATEPEPTPEATAQPQPATGPEPTAQPQPATGPEAAAEPEPAGPEASAGPAAPFGAGFATGDPECCVCPVCRSIAALRDPSPELAERLATGAGDFAAGLASLLRALSSVTGPTGRRDGTARTTGPGRDAGDDDAGDDDAGSPTAGVGPEAESGDGPEYSAGPSTPPGDGSTEAPGRWRETVWRDAASTRHDSWPVDEPDDVWAAATRAQAGTRETGTTAGPDRVTPAGTEPARPDAPTAAGRPPVPASRTPAGPVATGSGEQAAPGQDG